MSIGCSISGILQSVRNTAVLSNNYIERYPKVRIFLCTTYLLLSVAFLITCVVVNLENSDNFSFWLVEGVGEIINSIILIIQSIVMRQELLKERPYTPTHLLYCIYLNLITVARIVIVLIEIKNSE